MAARRRSGASSRREDWQWRCLQRLALLEVAVAAAVVAAAAAAAAVVVGSQESPLLALLTLRSCLHLLAPQPLAAAVEAAVQAAVAAAAPLLAPSPPSPLAPLCLELSPLAQAPLLL